MGVSNTLGLLVPVSYNVPFESQFRMGWLHWALMPFSGVATPFWEEYMSCGCSWTPEMRCCLGGQLAQSSRSDEAKPVSE
jgi:hypothetical protein